MSIKAKCLGVLFLITAFTTVCHGQTVVNMEYNSTQKTVYLSGEVGDSRDIISIVIAPEDVNGDTLDTETANSRNDILFKDFATSNTGAVQEEIEINSSFKDGRYLAYIDSKEISSQQLLYVYTDGKLSEIVSNINKAKSSDEVKDIILSSIDKTELDDGFAIKNATSIAEIIYGQKPLNGYLEKDFVNQYYIAEAVVKYQKKDVAFQDAVGKYGNYFGESINEYIILNDEEKSSIEDLLINRDFANNKIDEIIEEGSFLAKVRNIGSVAALQAYVTKYFDEKKWSYDDFSNLNSYYKVKVFEDLYGVRKNIDTADECYEKLISLINTYANKKDNSSASPTGGRGSGGGGGVSVTTPVENIETNQENNEVFADIKNYWAKETLELMYYYGYIKGFEDGTFRPDNNITRAEFVSIVSGMLNLIDTGESDFADVNKSQWYYDCVAKGAQAGIIYGDGVNFYPENNISRQDVAVIANRIINIKNSGAKIDGEIGFTDSDKISDYARESVSILCGYGVIKGYEDNTFRPENPVTRGEAATILYRLIKYIN